MYQRKELQVGKGKPVLQVPDFGDSTTGIISGCGVKAVTERGKVEKQGSTFVAADFLSMCQLEVSGSICHRRFSCL